MNFHNKSELRFKKCDNNAQTMMHNTLLDSVYLDLFIFETTEIP